MEKRSFAKEIVSTEDVSESAFTTTPLDANTKVKIIFTAKPIIIDLNEKFSIFLVITLKKTIKI